MSEAKLTLDGQEYEFSVVEGSEGEIGIDTTGLRGTTGAVSLDPGYGSTGSCQSSITYIDGENGVLRYRGYNIEDLAENASFEEVINLLIWGELPDHAGRVRRHRRGRQTGPRGLSAKRPSDGDVVGGHVGARDLLRYQRLQ